MKRFKGTKEVSEHLGLAERSEEADQAAKDFAAKAKCIRKESKLYNGSGKLDVRTFCDSWKKHIVTHRYAKERARKGYCFYDLMDVDGWFLRVMIDILTEFRDRTPSVPTALMLEEYAANKQDYSHLAEEDLWVYDSRESKRTEYQLLDGMARQRWRDVLTTIVSELETVERMSEDIVGHTDDYDAFYADLQQHLGNAFALLQKWLLDLWF